MYWVLLLYQYVLLWLPQLHQQWTTIWTNHQNSQFRSLILETCHQIQHNQQYGELSFAYTMGISYMLDKTLTIMIGLASKFVSFHQCEQYTQSHSSEGPFPQRTLLQIHPLQGFSFLQSRVEFLIANQLKYVIVQSTFFQFTTLVPVVSLTQLLQTFSGILRQGSRLRKDPFYSKTTSPLSNWDLQSNVSL